MKTQNESFDDIVFENRNKAYGAYDLRRKYSNRGTIAALITLFMMSFAVGGPLIANILKEHSFTRVLENTVEVKLEGIPEDEEKIKLPEPPPPKEDVNQVKFVAPKIVQEFSEPQLELSTFTDLINSSNPGAIDTSTTLMTKPIEKDELVPYSKIYNPIDIQEKPIFPGGDSELMRFIAEKTIYPEEAIEKRIEGTVYLRFVVTKSGDVGQVNILRPSDPLLENEALRVIKTLPKWTPGKYNGNPVNVWFIIPVKFKLQ